MSYKIEGIETVPVIADTGVNNVRTCEPSDAQVTQGCSRAVRAGGIYFIRAGDRIKIGFSTNPFDRFKQLQTSSPVDLELLAYLPGTFDDERDLHCLFATCHVRGEWFLNDPTILQYIKVRTGGALPIPYSRFKSIRPAYLMAELTKEKLSG